MSFENCIRWYKKYVETGNKKAAEDMKQHMLTAPKYKGITHSFLKELQTPKAKEEKKKEEPKTHTEKELYALNKDGQIKILNSLGVTDIPKYEKDRVNKILELQNGKK